MLCVIDISTLNKTYLIWFDQLPVFSLSKEPAAGQIDLFNPKNILYF